MKKISAFIAAVMLALSLFCTTAAAVNVNGEYIEPVRTETAASLPKPKFNASTGTYSKAFTLKMSAENGSVIYYTTDGTTPRGTSRKYTSSGVKITKSCTVKAVAVKNGVISRLRTAIFTLKVKTPSASLSGNIYSGNQTISLNCATSGADIYYTLDGSVPNKNSTLYTEPFTIDYSCTLQAVAVKSGWKKSKIKVEDYLIYVESDDWEDDFWNADYWSEDGDPIDFYWNGNSDGWDNTSSDESTSNDSTPNTDDTDNTADTDTTSSSTEVSYTWNDDYNTWTYSIDISDADYEYYSNLKYKSSDGVNYDYAAYVTDKSDDKFISELVSGFKKAADNAGYTEQQFLYMMIRFVQSIAYVSDYQSKGIVEYPKFPIEYLYDKCGDCEDSSILLASMLKAAGYDVVMLLFYDHMAVGLSCTKDTKGTYFTYNNKYYYFVETTTSGWNIGQHSVNYSDCSILTV